MSLLVPQYRVNTANALRFASQRYDIPDPFSCICVNPFNYNQDQYNRNVDGRTLYRSQGQVGACNNMYPYFNVSVVMQRQAEQNFQSAFQMGIPLRGYDAVAIARTPGYNSQACRLPQNSMGTNMIANDPNLIEMSDPSFASYADVSSAEEYVSY